MTLVPLSPRRLADEIRSITRALPVEGLAVVEAFVRRHRGRRIGWLTADDVLTITDDHVSARLLNVLETAYLLGGRVQLSPLGVLRRPGDRPSHVFIADSGRVYRYARRCLALLADSPRQFLNARRENPGESRGTYCRRREADNTDAVIARHRRETRSYLEASVPALEDLLAYVS